MQQELFPLPNLNFKILRPNIKVIPENLLVPVFCGDIQLFDFLEKIGITGLKPEEFDILIIIFHLYFTDRKEDGFLYFNTDDILLFRGVKRNKALADGHCGYKKTVRERIDALLKHLAGFKIFTVVDYKDFNYVLYLHDEFTQNIDGSCLLSQKLLTLNPHSKGWHKSIGIHLSLSVACKKATDREIMPKKDFARKMYITIQVKKLLKLVSLGSLFPFQIRNRFEDVMDELCKMGIIKKWCYKNIDEEMLNSKNWLFFWKLLSVKIGF